ncbi:MAG TPA: hypothetical protein V6C88_00500, partial [Chroococcidiopsis sp.]
TIRLDVSSADDPQALLLKALNAADIDDAVVRLIYRLRADQLVQIDTSALQTALAIAHTYSIHPELVSQLAHPRLPELGVGNTIAPVEALAAYLDNHPHLSDLKNDMLQAAQALLTADAEPWSSSDPSPLGNVSEAGASGEFATAPWDEEPIPEPTESQLRLL